MFPLCHGYSRPYKVHDEVCVLLLSNHAGSTSNDVVEPVEASGQPSNSLAAEKPPTTSTTTTTTTTTSVTPPAPPVHQNNDLDELDVVTPPNSRPRGPLHPERRDPPSVSFDPATRHHQRPRGHQFTSPQPRRRWPPRRGRYPPPGTRHRYGGGRRPPYVRSASHPRRRAVSPLLAVLSVLLAMSLWLDKARRIPALCFRLPADPQKTCAPGQSEYRWSFLFALSSARKNVCN